MIALGLPGRGLIYCRTKEDEVGCALIGPLRDFSRRFSPRKLVQNNLHSLLFQAMATGIEILGAVSASLEIVKVAKACLSVFNGVRNISLAIGEQSDAHFSLVVQGIKLERWCSSVGIQDVIRIQASKHPKESQRAEEMAVLQNVLMPQLRLKNIDIYAVTQSALEGMRKKFDDAFNVLRRYSKDMDEPSVEDEPAKPSTKWNKRTWKG